MAVSEHYTVRPSRRVQEAGADFKVETLKGEEAGRRRQTTKRRTTVGDDAVLLVKFNRDSRQKEPTQLNSAQQQQIM